MKYRKRPVVINAVQWIGDMVSVISLVGYAFPDYGEGRSGSLRIATLEGDHECRMGDWIIKGVKGEFYPCKPDIFAATYDEEIIIEQHKMLIQFTDAPQSETRIWDGFDPTEGEK